jgi:hypothetical protein
VRNIACTFQLRNVESKLSANYSPALHIFIRDATVPKVLDEVKIVF